MQADHEPDVGYNQSRKPDEMPQKIYRNQTRGMGERIGNEECMDKEKESRHAKPYDAHTGNQAVAITVEPDGEREPEKSNEVKHRKCHRESLQKIDRFK